MSLCDICLAPGMCCRRFTLSTRSFAPGVKREEVQEFLDELTDPQGRPYPFRAVEPVNPEGYDVWIWTCPKLQADGRCSIYEDRPETCRIYAPRQDRMCVHFEGAEGGEGAVWDHRGKAYTEEDGPGREVDEVKLHEEPDGGDDGDHIRGLPCDHEEPADPDPGVPGGAGCDPILGGQHPASGPGARDGEDAGASPRDQQREPAHQIRAGHTDQGAMI